MRWMLAGTILLSAALAAAQPVTEPAKAHPEYAVRAGIHATAMEIGETAPEGSGLLLEGGAEWRFNSWLSLGAFGAFSRLDSTVLLYDLGMRFSMHWHGAFGGLGLGVEEFSDRGRWDHGPLGELHVGYRFPVVSFLRSAPEIIATVGRSTTSYDGYISTARLAIGVVF